jgi:hypothetical protein
MMRLVQAEGRLLQRIVATTPLVARHGLCHEAFAKFDAAQSKTSWALRHRRRFALMQADEVLASADRYHVDHRGVWRPRRLGRTRGAILQALIAREPAESRHVIRGWLPPGFLPPQATIASASPAPPLLLARALSSRVRDVHLTGRQVMYWRSDLF